MTSAAGPRHHRGFAMGSVLLLALVVTLLGASIGALALFQLIEAQQVRSSNDAVMLAESAINATLDRLSTAPVAAFGTSSDTLIYKPDGSATDRNGTVTFDPLSSLPYSTNNLTPPGAAAWDASLPAALQVGYRSVPVPPGYARIIGVGQSGTVQRRVEAMVTREHFPYGLAWGGTLTADALHAFGVASLAEFVETRGSPPLVSQASVACLGSIDPSLSSVHISGSLYYAGSTPALPADTVIALVEQKQSGLQIPDIPVSNLFLAAQSNLPATPAPGPIGAN
ncbi:MAG: hypothetical protein ACYCW6_25155, partial [Candidatus Xenobia bacterium]